MAAPPARRQFVSPAPLPEEVASGSWRVRHFGAAVVSERAVAPRVPVQPARIENRRSVLVRSSLDTVLRQGCSVSRMPGSLLDLWARHRAACACFGRRLGMRAWRCFGADAPPRRPSQEHPREEPGGVQARRTGVEGARDAAGRGCVRLPEVAVPQEVRLSPAWCAGSVAFLSSGLVLLLGKLLVSRARRSAEEGGGLRRSLRRPPPSPVPLGAERSSVALRRGVQTEGMS